MAWCSEKTTSHKWTHTDGFPLLQRALDKQIHPKTKNFHCRSTARCSFIHLLKEAKGRVVLQLDHKLSPHLHWRRRGVFFCSVEVKVGGQARSLHHVMYVNQHKLNKVLWLWTIKGLRSLTTCCSSASVFFTAVRTQIPPQWIRVSCSWFRVQRCWFSFTIKMLLVFVRPAEC